MRIVPMLAALGVALPALAETVVLQEDFESLSPGNLPTEQALNEGGRIQIFNPEFAGQAEIQGDFVHTGKQALTLRRDSGGTTPVIFLTNFQPLPGTVYRVTMNFLRPDDSAGGATLVNFGGSSHHSAGWMINAVRKNFQYWNGEGAGQWEESEIPAPAGEWISLSLTLKIEEIDGQLSGRYDLSAESDLQEKQELAKDISMGTVTKGAVRLFLLADKPLPGRHESAAHWDNLRISVVEE